MNDHSYAKKTNEACFSEDRMLKKELNVLK